MSTPTGVRGPGERRRRDAPGSLDYHAAVRAMRDRGRFGVRLGLERTRALLAELGDPQRSFRGALVAGTNGKGSVLALAGSALRAAGYRVGETPKPHLVSYRERIQVDGSPIAADDFAALVSDVLAVADRVGPDLGPATEFELLTAAMFRWFADRRVEVAIVEVGLGGRLDATHAWDGGVAVVTNVELDHTDRLGSTVEAIAREKAAIIERGDVAVTGATGSALEVVRARARALGASLRVVAPAALLGWDRDGIDVAVGELGPTRVGLRGRHQAANAAVADALLDALAVAGIATAPADARREGYRDARWPGRLELVIHDGREILLDGAHNPAGAAALAQAVDDLRPFLVGGREGHAPAVTLVIGAMADKDIDGVLDALFRSAHLGGAHVVATAVAAERALPADVLAARVAARLPGSRVRVVPGAAGALAAALAAADGPIVVAGSLYLVGEIRALIVDDPDLRDPPPVDPGPLDAASPG